jgi:hypothetical protein
VTFADPNTVKPNGQGGMMANLQTNLQNLRDTGSRKIQAFARQPKFDIPISRKKSIHLETDRVRAAPAITPTLSGMIGQTATVIGIAGLFFPKAVKRALGITAPTPVVQTLFGARELWSGYSLMGDPTKTEVLWARVAGDVFDIAVLKALDNERNPQRGNARAALGFVLFVTALDVVTATRMTNVQRNCTGRTAS